MTATLDVSVIVPTIGRVEQLERCLESLRACSPRAAEVVVVAQGDPEPTIALVARFADIGARVVRCAGFGIPLGRNKGWREARHDVVLMTDDDCTVAQDWIARGTAHVNAHPDAIATGRVLPEGGAESVPSTISEPQPRVFVGASGVGRLFPNNMAASRSLILDFGAFDERIVPAAEDNDLSYRWLRAGRALRYEPDIVVWHADWRDEPALRRMYVGYGRGQGAFYAKHLRRRDAMVLPLLAREIIAVIRLSRQCLSERRSPWSNPRFLMSAQIPIGIAVAWRRFGDEASARPPAGSWPRFWLRDLLERWLRRARALRARGRPGVPLHQSRGDAPTPRDPLGRGADRGGTHRQ